MIDRHCPLCALARGDPEQHRTRWLFMGRYWAVVEDADPKGFALRLLYVPRIHLLCGDESKEMRLIAKNRLHGFAKALEAEGKLRLVQTDLDKHRFRAHWHAQACFEEVE